MTFTILASIFIFIILLVAIVGFKAAKKQVTPPEDIDMEKCSVCRRKFNKTVLIERQIGDYKILFFCPGCITGLHNEMVRKN